MSKYSNEFKLEIVKYYLEGHHSRAGTARKFGMLSSTPLKEWIKKYQEHGPEGLIKQQKSSYSGEFKQNVVEYMHDNHLSSTQTAVHFKLQTPIVLKWERIYYEEGPQSLYKERCGRSRNMESKPKKKKQTNKLKKI